MAAASTITRRNLFGYGAATGSDGRRYDLETDIRAMEGSYVAEDGSRRRALFAGL